MAITQGTVSHNFDPQNYNDPDVKQKDGTYQLTDYQAALIVRNWMHANMSGSVMDGKYINEAMSNGTITHDGKTIKLTEQQKAAFGQFAANDAGLFKRLDGGENGTHDNWIGEWDIDAAIKNGRLHGTAEHSKDGYWRNRNDDMTTADAGGVLNKFFKEKFGDDWSTMTQNDIRLIANTQNFRDPKNNGKLTAIDDQAVIQAAGVLADNWGKIQIGEGNSVGTLSREELEKLMSV